MSKIIAPRLASLCIAVPENVIAQDDVIDITDEMFGPRFEDYEQLRPVFINTGIQKRHLAMPLQWYFAEHDWPDRTDAYLQKATELFCSAAKDALVQAGLKADDIDAVVTISSTGIATPSLEARALSAVGFRNDIFRVPVFGMGCGGGVAGLTLAARLARSEPESRVLLVAVELCTMSFRMDKLTKANIVATALFGDGAAAAVVSTNASDVGPEIGASHQHTWPDTLNIMGWKVDPTGFEVVFDRAIPPFARRHVRPVINGFLEEMHLAPADLARLTFHPGGTKVLEALEAAFELQTGALDYERQVLRDYGNMSAPTILFVLQKTIAAKLQGQHLLTALGPGYTAASIPVRIVQ